MWCWSSNRPPPIRTAIVTQNFALARKRSREFVVVDQPGATDPHRQHRERPRAPESLGIDHLGVVDFRERFSFEPGPQHLPKLFRSPLPSGIFLGGKRRGGV